jgi:phage recombination protein Bet
MTEVAIRDGSGLALRSDQEFWTDKQRAALEQLGVADASNADLAVFLHVAQRSGLDPFARQVYMIGRREKRRTPQGEQWTTRQTIQTGIDGYRLIARRAADRAGEKLAEPQPLWCGRDLQWREAWIDDEEPPAAAKVVVYRDGEPFAAVAMFREFCQTGRDGEPMGLWRKMPANQLAKCAEAQALRKAYPQELAGVYVEDEMQQADSAPRRAHRVVDSTPVQPVTVDELNSHDVVADALPAEPSHPTDPVGGQRIASQRSIGKLIGMLSDLGVESDEDQRAWLSRELQREVTTRTSLTQVEVNTAIPVVQTLIDVRDAEAAEAAERAERDQ